MLLDPFEEQFHLQSAFVQLGDGECWEREVVRQEHQPSFVFGVVERHTTQRIRIESRRFLASQHDGLIGAQPRRLVDRTTRTTRAVEASFGPSYEERRALSAAIQTLEVDVP